MSQPENDIAAAIAAASLGTLGVDLFTGPVRDGSDLNGVAIFVLETSGFDPVPDLGGPGAPNLRARNVQIRVRSERDTYTSGKAKASAVWSAIHKQHSADYVSWTAGEPIYIERDESGRHHWSINTLVRTHG